MSDAPKIVGCAEEGCEIATGGRCLNGIDPPLTCPHIQLAEAQMEEGEEEEEREGDQGDSKTLNAAPVKLRTGEAFDLVGAECLARERGVNVVALFAPSNAGKTTLMAKLYESFHRGPLGELTFAGSETMVAFEKLCHGCRIGSGSVHPTVPHTRRGEPNYLHLKLRDSQKTQDFLIVDRNGEEYTDAIGSSEQCQQLFEIGRCDVLLMLLDGERMLDGGRRNVAVDEIARGLRALLDNGLLDHLPYVQILLTKYDIVEENEEIKSDIDATFESLRTSIQSDIGDLPLPICFAKVAARPVRAPAEEARKLDRIIGRWPFAPVRGQPSKQVTETVRPERAFLNFGVLSSGSLDG